MTKQRKTYSAELKAKIALEAIKGQRTVNEIAVHYEVHPNQVTNWKKASPGRTAATLLRCTAPWGAG